jgi:hypothetical protein
MTMAGQHDGIYMEPGAKKMVVGASGEIEVASGGKLGQQSAEADLNQTISGSYSQSEVQAISDKVDALLAKLRLAGILAT